MGNIDSYILESGKRPFDDLPLTMVDCAVLSYLAYFDFRSIVPSPGKGGRITIRDAANRYRSLRADTQKNVIPAVLDHLGESRRFGSAYLSDFVDVFREGTCQFAALCVTLGDGSRHLLFRGVDDTLTAWLESFRISYRVTPSQKMAVLYTNRTAKKYARDGSPLYLEGHSKGGNLALYAACECDAPVRAGITRVFNFDGPGLTPFLYGEADYMDLEGRVTRAVPEYSIIGCLFFHGAPDFIASSGASGIGQHELTTWSVNGTGFERLRSMDRRSRKIALTLNRWIASTGFEERESFTEDLFAALKKEGLTIPVRSRHLLSFLIRSYFSAARASKTAAKKFLGARYVTDINAFIRRNALRVRKRYTGSFKR